MPRSGRYSKSKPRRLRACPREGRRPGDIGQLATLTAPGSKTWTYSYDGYGRLTKVDLPNGMHTAYTYDRSGRQDAIHHRDGTTVVQGFDYTFPPSADLRHGGNITRIDHKEGTYRAYDYAGAPSSQTTDPDVAASSSGSVVRVPGRT